MSLRMKLTLVVTLVALCVPAVILFADPGEPDTVPVVSSHEFDAINRVTQVSRDNGQSVSYQYDAAGNIVGATATGRSSATLPGSLGLTNSEDEFIFTGACGEPITLRLEASPRADGVGKFATIHIPGKSVTSALPVELTMVLPVDGPYQICVDAPSGDERAFRYLGAFTLTLEAQASTTATFANNGTPPVITCALPRTLLWPARNGLLPVGLSASATDNCDPDPVLEVDVWSTEPEGTAPYAPDAASAGTIDSLRLRAERQFPGSGRVYMVVVRATDRGGRSSIVPKAVTVPVYPVGYYILSVRRRASMAEAMMLATGSPGPGFTKIHAYTVDR